MSKVAPIKDDLYSFIKTYYSKCEITSKEEAKTKLGEIFYGIGVAEYNAKGNIFFYDGESNKELELRIQAENDPQCSAFINAVGTHKRHTTNDYIREILFNYFRPVRGESDKINELSEYFRNDKYFKPSGNTIEFLSYFKNNALDDPDDCDEILSFINEKDDPYLRAAWIFAFVCFPKERQIENAVDRNRFFNEISPFLSRSKKECPEVKDITEDSISSCGKINQSYIGRDTELSEIEELIRTECHVVLYGLGGIGKTFICRKLFWSHRAEYKDGIKYVAWIKYNKSLVQSFRDTFIIKLAPDEYGKKPDSFEQYSYEPVIQEMYKDLNSLSRNARDIVAKTVKTAFNKLGRSLLVFIDNANEITSDEINWLNTCSCRIIVTSRQPLDGFASLHIEGPDMDYCCELYKKNCDNKQDIKFTTEENECIRQIVERAGRHTLSIELIAKAQKASHKDVKYMLEQLKSTGFSLSGISETIVSNGEKSTFIEHLSKVFDTTDIQKNESQIKIMRYFSLLEPNTAINPNTIKAWFELDNFDGINTLIEMGWLNEEENNYLSIHPIISDIIRYRYPPDYSYSEPLVKSMCKYYDNVTDFRAFIDNVKQYKSVSDRFDGIKEESYAGLLFMTAYCCQAVMSHESAVRYYDKLIAICKDETPENDFEKGIFELIKGLKLELLKKFIEAIACYKSALELMKSAFSDNPHFKPYLYDRIGAAYSNMQNYNKASENYTAALRLYEGIYGEDNIYVGFCYANIAFTLAALEEFNSAWKSIDKAESIAKNDETGFLKESIHFFKGIIYCIQDDPQNAQKYLDNAFVSDSLYSKIPMLSIQINPIRAEIYADNGEHDKALKMLDNVQKSLNNEPETFDNCFQNKYLQLVNTYLSKSDIYIKEGKYALFLENYYQAVNVWNENINGFDTSAQSTKNIAIRIVNAAYNAAHYCISQNFLYDALMFYNGIIDLIEPYVVESVPEFALGIYCITALLFYKKGELQNSLEYYQKVIELSIKHSLQDDEFSLQAKEQIEKIQKQLQE